MLAFIAQHLWQSTLIVVMAWLLTLVCRRDAAVVRYWIWLAASVKFLVPLALLRQLGDRLGQSLPEPLPLAPALIETASAVFVPSIPRGAAATGDIPSQWVVAVAMIWVLGSLLLCWRWLRQWQAIRASLTAIPRVSMDLPVPVCITSSELPTGVFGIFRPVVILPRRVMQALSAQQLRAVLAHESCHIRRRDNLLAALHRCVEVIFWFHPLVWWIGAKLLHERETACDESVIEQGYEPALYARSILDACRIGIAPQRSQVAASTGGNLARRLTSIMSGRCAPPIGHERFALLFLTATVVCFAPLAAGVASGAVRAAADTGPVVFDAIALEPAAPAWWHSARLDPDSGRIVLKNFSLRELISLAYPGSTINGEPAAIDRARYDIEAQWRAQSGTRERTLYRELLKQVLETNSNLEFYVRNLR